MITNFDYYNPTRISFGTGNINGLGEKIKIYGKKALIVCTGNFFIEYGLTDKVQSILREASIASEVYTDVSPNPLTTEIDRGADLGRKKGCDIIIGLGGGSAIDAAKAIAVAIGHEKPIWKFYPGSKGIEEEVTSKTLPIIAITTTSGTGSHMTCFSVLTNPENKEKPGLGNEFLFPKVSIVDPELMLTMPPKITAATGFDVLAHAIEAYTSRISTPITDLYCEEAMRLVAKYLVKAVNNGKDIESREMMALADTLAGMAITIAVITLCHSISHVICGIYNLVHGESLAAMTPHTIGFSMNENPVKFAKIGAILNKQGSDEIDEITDKNKDIYLEKTVNSVKKLIKDISLDIPLSKQGVKKSDFVLIASETLGYMANGVALDLREVSEKDLIDILEKAL